MKKLFFTISFVFLLSGVSFADKPYFTFAGIRSDSQRGGVIASLFDTHFMNILHIVNSFGIVDFQMVRNQLDEYRCYESSCLERLAGNSGMSVIAAGTLEDHGDYLILEMVAYGADPPFYGKTICSYKVKIDVSKEDFSAREYSYLAEEHSGRFLGKLLNAYKSPAYGTKNSQGEYDFPDIEENGEYEVYTSLPGENVPGMRKIGTMIKADSSISTKTDEMADKIFVLKSYKKDGSFLENYYYGRKREIVFYGKSGYETLEVAAATPLLSVLAPIAAPVSYFMESDYNGMGLAFLNAAPYYYITYRGLSESPSSRKDSGKSVTSRNVADRYFAFYNLFIGGMSIFTDAYAHYTLKRASNFSGVQPYMGNDYTAIMLAALTPGGGHFYRGNRFWGYTYYHVDNLLLYSALYYLSTPEQRDPATGSYTSGKAKNKKLGYASLGALGIVKIVEIMHVMYSKDSIKNGQEMEPSYAVTPLINSTPENGLMIGINISTKY